MRPGHKSVSTNTDEARACAESAVRSVLGEAVYFYRTVHAIGVVFAEGVVYSERRF